MKLTLLLFACATVTYATVCYTPATFTVKHDTLKTAYLNTQAECENLCTAEAQCTAIVTEQRPSILWCVLLGAEAPVNCAPPTAVFKKSTC